MNAYVYQATLLCEDCAQDTCNRLVGDSRIAILSMDDSDSYPQGPYANGGGESDSPNHCDHCGEFLENPLTTDGWEYVKHVCSLAEYCHVGMNSIRDTWRQFYGIDTDA